MNFSYEFLPVRASETLQLICWSSVSMPGRKTRQKEDCCVKDAKNHILITIWGKFCILLFMLSCQMLLESGCWWVPLLMGECKSVPGSCYQGKEKAVLGGGYEQCSPWMPEVCVQAVSVNELRGVFPKVRVHGSCVGLLYKLHEPNFET